MKKKLVALLAGAMLTMTVGAANAVFINYNTTPIGNQFFSPFAGLQTETFNNATPLGAIGSVTGLDQAWTWTGNGSVLNTAVTNRTASPFGVSAPDATPWLSVPNPASSGSLTVGFGNTYNYFGLWWGSVDSYNTITFKNGNTTVASFTGPQTINPSIANGNQTAPSQNLYINFLFAPNEVFDKVEFKSTAFAFEMDNLAVGNVPEPGTMVLLGAGIIGLGIYGRRRNKK